MKKKWEGGAEFHRINTFSKAFHFLGFFFETEGALFQKVFSGRSLRQSIP